MFVECTDARGLVRGGFSQAVIMFCTANRPGLAGYGLDDVESLSWLDAFYAAIPALQFGDADMITSGHIGQSFVSAHRVCDSVAGLEGMQFHVECRERALFVFCSSGERNQQRVTTSQVAVR